MNCQNHPEVTASDYCRTCGKPLCDQCRRDVQGTVFCAEHLPAPAPGAEGANPWTAPYPPPGTVPPRQYVADVSPGLAFLLGWIPGVGAIYNGQYAKGLIHAVIWGLIVSLINSRAANGLEPIFGILVTVWMFYMAFEAYHAARKRRLGEPVDEYSSLINIGRPHANAPVAAIALIVLGVIFLMHTLDLLDFEYVARYWPVLLIAAGAWLLYGRLKGQPTAPPIEVRHERQ